MLDFSQLVVEIQTMVASRSRRWEAYSAALGQARASLEQFSPRWAEIAAALRGQSWPWLVAIPREPLLQRTPASAPPECYTVVACDGSQIAPDRHEVASCYLLNISRVRISYGDGRRPALSSQPRLYYEDEDLSVQEGGARVPMEGKYLAIRRMVEETQELARLVRESQGNGPCVGLADGTLIQWPITREAAGYSGEALQQFLDALESARQCGVPVAGYISAPGGSSVVSTLRAIDCRAGFPPGGRCFCSSPRADDVPTGSVCEGLALASDAAVFGGLLAHGERSAIFESTSQVLGRYGHHAICFFYLSVGREVARVEIPLWVAEDPAAVNLVHAVAFDQAVKGRGYPVALSEAHEKAVVQAADRALFFQLIEKELVRKGLPAEHSLKALSKRQPFV